jgi:hypothetical protein
MTRTSFGIVLVMIVGAAACGGDAAPGWLPTDASTPAAVDAGARPTSDPGASRSDLFDAGQRAGGDAGSPSAPGLDAGLPVAQALALLPWAEGNSWTYRVTGGGEESVKVTTVGALEPVGGSGPNAAKLANKTVTKKGATDETIGWQAVEGDRLVRYREQSFGKTTGQLQLEEHWDPFKLHVDWSAQHTQIGASWVESYVETKLPADAGATTSTESDTWTVDGVNQTVTVPAGTFSAIVLIKVGGSSPKTYWYVPGVGKVKETGGQTEELVSYQVAP